MSKCQKNLTKADFRGKNQKDLSDDSILRQSQSCNLVPGQQGRNFAPLAIKVRLITFYWVFIYSTMLDHPWEFDEKEKFATFWEASNKHFNNMPVVLREVDIY